MDTSSKLMLDICSTALFPNLVASTFFPGSGHGAINGLGASAGPGGLSQLSALNGLNLLPHQLAGANHMDATSSWIPQLPPQQGLDHNSAPLLIYPNNWAAAAPPAVPSESAGYASKSSATGYASREYGYDLEYLQSHLMMHHQRKQQQESIRM